MNKIVKRDPDQKDACKLSLNEFNCYHQSGFSLIELMIAISLGLLLFGILMEMFITNQNGLKIQTALYGMQDSAKTAISILTSEMHRAGAIGCARLSADFPVTSFHEYEINRANRIRVTPANEIIVRYASYPNAFVYESMQNNKTVYTDNADHFAAGDILLISNCKQAEIFQAASVRNKNGLQELVTSAPLHNQYEKYSEVSRLVINKLFINKTGRKNSDGSDIYSLFVEDIHRNKTELVSGINQMRMTFTLDMGGKLQEVQQQEINNWAQVVGIAIDMDVSANAMQKTWHMYAALQG